MKKIYHKPEMKLHLLLGNKHLLSTSASLNVNKSANDDVEDFDDLL